MTAAHGKRGKAKKTAAHKAGPAGKGGASPKKGTVAPDQRRKRDADYKARRAAADAELAPVVMELVRGFYREADKEGT